MKHLAIIIGMAMHNFVYVPHRRPLNLAEGSTNCKNVQKSRTEWHEWKMGETEEGQANTRSN